MSLTYDFYAARAKAAAEAANGTTLINVRERELRSARAWQDMADRQLLLEAERVKADQIRAERRAAELAAANALRQPEPG